MFGGEELAEQDAHRQERATRQEAALPERKTTNQGSGRGCGGGRTLATIGRKKESGQEGKRRKDADAARLQEKKLRHRRKVAEKMEKARRHEAQAER